MANKGFIKLSRTFFDTPLWKNIDRPYTHAEAWLDLLSLFRVTNTTVTETFNRIPVTYGPNQTPISYRNLAMRWRRNEAWAHRFLDTLVDSNLIAIDNTKKVTLVTLSVTPGVTPNVTPKPAATKELPKIDVTPDVTPDVTLSVTDTYYKEEIEEDIKKPHTIVCGKESPETDFAAPAAIRTRAANFYNSLVPYVPTYGREMVRAFYDYWTEPNRSQTHMRYELERTWSLPLRLKTWAKREKQTNHNNHATDKYEQKRIDIALREARYMEDIKRLDAEYLARQQS